MSDSKKTRELLDVMASYVEEGATVEVSSRSHFHVTIAIGPDRDSAERVEREFSSAQAADDAMDALQEHLTQKRAA